ncbi:MAG: hypothetical protein KTR31_36905 [Myxococcales bacterium]|nr:hypothetical protein [Myxococcales bacterium]
MHRTSTLALLALAGVACQGEQGFVAELPELDIGAPAPPEEVEQTDVIVQVTTPRVDILYTIDNSCSMSNEQVALGEAFPQFIGYFVGSGLDYHIGVVSTDMDSNAHKGKLRTAGGNKWIEATTPNPEGVFTAMANMGTTGSATERGIGTTYNAIEVLEDTFNSGFYRDEASIHTVIVSDEPDFTQASVITLPEFITWYDGLKPEADDRTFSSIVGTRTGGDYAQVTREIGGIVFDIEAENWGEVLDRLGVQASGLKREYYLSQQPVMGTIRVEVEQTIEGGDVLVQEFYEVVNDPETGEYVEGDWNYNEIRNSITFREYVPAALARVKLTYDLLAATQDDDIEPVAEETVK